MQGNIQKRNLLVISDSPVKKVHGGIWAYEPVVRELEAIADQFDSIVWLGAEVNADHFALSKSNLEKLKIVAMPSVQNKIANAFFVFFSYPVFLFYILKYLPSATHVHTRGPSHPALLGVLISFFVGGKIYWHKYAGNWIVKDVPFMYQLQKQLLKRADYRNISVTVNGKWNDVPKQVRSFENPCMSQVERKDAYDVAFKKDFTQDLKLLYVGNLSVSKGVIELMDAITNEHFSEKISDVYFAGNGLLHSILQEKTVGVTSVNIHLMGHLSRNELNKLYASCHIIILPSLSEGFPKVIAEGAAHGCIPVVTNISSLSQYIVDQENGYLMKNNSSVEIMETLHSLLQSNNLKQVSMNATKFTEKFTFEYFKERIENEILV